MMKADLDRDKTLTELEGQDWGPPNFDSHLVTTIHQLRHKPLGQFTAEDLRICIGQNVGLEHLVPMAIEHLQSDPFVEGNYYRGDLLVAVLKVEGQLWSKHPQLRQVVSEVVQQAEARRKELTEVEAEALTQGFISFQDSESKD